MDLIDISLPIAPSMLSWPTGRPAAEHRVVDEGDVKQPRNSEWLLDSHAGTHIDAPLHWLPGAADVQRLPLTACVGPCAVAAIPDDGPVGAEALPPDLLGRGKRLLLRTANSLRLSRDEFDPNFAALTPEAARALAEAGIALVGLDYLSVESPTGDGEVHRTLLQAGVVLLEGIDLSAVVPGKYQLSALPLRLAGGEASPVRAVLWR
jgi:arylformamidase